MSGFDTICSYLCSPSVNMLDEHKMCTACLYPMQAYMESCIAPSKLAQKIRVPREYMLSDHNLYVRRIKACVASTPSVLTAYATKLYISARRKRVTTYSCAIVSFRDPKGLF